MLVVCENACFFEEMIFPPESKRPAIIATLSLCHLPLCLCKNDAALFMLFNNDSNNPPLNRILASTQIFVETGGGGGN